MKKRIFSIVLTLCMVLMLVPATVFADTISGTTEDGFSYTISDAGEVTITRYNGSVADVEIPSLIQLEDVDYIVTAIGENGFNHSRNIKSVKIPDSVTSIGDDAFFFCTSLTNVTFEENSQLTSIGNYAFAECTSLTSITIPSSVTSIGYEPFFNCTSLTSIMVDENNTAYSSVDGVLFNKDKTILIKCPIGKTSTSYSIPDGVEIIGVAAFEGCINLKSITIPDGVTSIGERAFYNCTNLERITIPDGVTSIGEATFYNCTNLKSITIPDGVTSIGQSAFHSCISLTSITIPNSVTRINDYAFYNCIGLKDVYYLGTEVEWGNINISGYGNDDLNGKVRYVGDITQGVTFTPPSNLTYDGEAKEATVTKNNQELGDFTVKYYEQSGQECAASPVEAGTYTVKIDIAASEKYDAISGYEIGRFTILQAENSFTTDLSIEGWTYGDTPKAPTAEAKFGTPTYSYSTEEDGTYTTTQPTNAGTYWVKAVVEGTDNYTGLEDKIQFTISPKTYTVTYAGGSNGNGTVTAGSKTHDVPFTLSSDTFTRTGYEQTGWATSDGGEKVYDLGGTYTDNNDITLYPVWSHEHIDAEPKDHICDICGVTFYGHSLEKIPAKDATVTETGNTEYWHCLDCGKYFADENGTNEIELSDTVTQKLSPEIIEGKGQSVTAGEKKELTFRSNAALDDFIRVELDGVTVDAENYTATEGSTIITLKADYVATLSAGEHTIGIVSESGTASTTFTVNAKTAVDNDTKSPQTGDNSHMALWFVLLAASVFGLAGTAIYSKRKRVR